MNSANELSGQMELTDYQGTGMDEGTGNREQVTGETGYDAEGHLINPANTANGEGDPDANYGVPTDRSESVPPVGAALRRPPASTDTRLSILAIEITTIERQARGVAMSAALEIGKRLIEAKGLVPEGRWGEWLAANVSYSDRRAQDLMRLAEQYSQGTLPEAISRLDYSKAVALLAAPEEAREALAQRTQDEELSVRQLRDEIKKLKAEANDQQLVIDGLRVENERWRDDGAKYEDRADRLAEELQNAKNVIATAAQKVSLAEAKAAAAESSATELRKLHSDAEDRAAASAQRASDAVNRANQTAKELSEARARIAELEAVAASSARQDGETVERVVEVVPDAVQRELNELRLKLAEANANAARPSSLASPERGGGPEGAGGVSATEKFKWFYANQMKPAFTTALSLLREVAQEDGHAASMFATALTNACKQLMGQLGE